MHGNRDPSRPQNHAEVRDQLAVTSFTASSSSQSSGGNIVATDPRTKLLVDEARNTEAVLCACPRLAAIPGMRWSRRWTEFVDGFKRLRALAKLQHDVVLAVAWSLGDALLLGRVMNTSGPTRRGCTVLKSRQSRLSVMVSLPAGTKL